MAVLERYDDARKNAVKVRRLDLVIYFQNRQEFPAFCLATDPDGFRIMVDIPDRRLEELEEIIAKGQVAS